MLEPHGGRGPDARAEAARLPTEIPILRCGLRDEAIGSLHNAVLDREADALHPWLAEVGEQLARLEIETLAERAA